MNKISAFIALLLVFQVTAVFSLGSGEKGKAKEGTLLTEEARKVDFFLLSTKPPGTSSADRPLPGSEAAAFLFQSFENKGGTIRIASHRNLSMPIQRKEVIQWEGDLWITNYAAEIDPEKPVSYSPRSEVKVEFGLTDIYSEGRVTYQPAQKALLLAIQQEDAKPGLIRVKSLSTKKGESYSAVVEIADQGPRRK